MVNLNQLQIGTIIRQRPGIVGVVHDVYVSQFTGCAVLEVRFVKNAYLRQATERQDFDLIRGITDLATVEDLEAELTRIRTLAETDARNMVDAAIAWEQFEPIAK